MERVRRRGMPKCDRSGQAAVLSTEELDALMQSLSPYYRAVFQTARFSAGRISEVLHLKWSNVYPDCLVIPKAITKKKVRTREIPLHPKLQEELGALAHKVATDLRAGGRRLRLLVSISEGSHEICSARLRGQSSARSHLKARLQRGIHAQLPAIGADRRQRRGHTCEAHHGAVWPSEYVRAPGLPLLHCAAEARSCHGLRLTTRTSRRRSL